MFSMEKYAFERGFEKGLKKEFEKSFKKGFQKGVENDDEYTKEEKWAISIIKELYDKMCADGKEDFFWKVMMDEDEKRSTLAFFSLLVDYNIDFKKEHLL